MGEPSPAGSARPREVVMMLGLVALAFGLRLHNVTGDGIWNDEAYSIRLAGMSLARMAEETARDIHPPFYYALLHFWLRVAGAGELSVRALSVFFGVLAVPLLFALGRSIGGLRLGLLAGSLAAISPFSVYYSQETRMYTLAVALVSAAAWFAWRALRGAPPARWMPGYVAACGLGLYTHFYVVLSFVGFNVAYLLLAVPGLWAKARQTGLWRPLRPVAWWSAAQVAVLLLFSPWIPVLVEKNVEYLSPGRGTPVDQMVYEMATEFVVGRLAGTAGIDWFVLCAWLVAGGALAYHLVPRGRAEGEVWLQRGVLFAAVWLIAGFVVIYATSVGKRDFASRYMIVGLPAFNLLVAGGLYALWRFRAWAFAASAGVLLAGSFWALTSYYEEPNSARPDHRTAVDALSRLERSGDVVVLNAYYTAPVFEYYYRGDNPYVGLPAEHPPNVDATYRQLGELADRHQRIWGLYWQDYFSDGAGIVDTWLRNNLIWFHEEQFLGWVRLKGYERREPGELVFGEAIVLEGYEVIPSPLPAGGEAKVRLHWRSHRQVERDYQVFVHVVDEDYTFYGQHDGTPAGGSAPTSRWQAGQLIVDEHPVPLAEGAADRHLEIRVGLYDLESGERLRNRVADNLLLARVRAELAHPDGLAPEIR